MTQSAAYLSVRPCFKHRIASLPEQAAVNVLAYFKLLSQFPRNLSEGRHALTVAERHT
jgi:hypothetical protein